jgi:CTP:molybdopterin cytidylyltransferase MocA
MNIAVLFIATSFKVRMKINGKTLLMQSDKQKFAAFLDELSIWVENSDEKLTPVIITCFDEIYEIAVERHFKVFSNKFTNVAQWNMIRFGVNSCAGYDAYFVLDSKDARLFKAEIFEKLCILSENNRGKIVLSELGGVPGLPMVFPKDMVESVRRIFDDKGGKLNLQANSGKILVMEITKEILEENIYKRHYDLNNIEQRNHLREVRGISPSEMSSRQGISADGSDVKAKTVKSRVVIIRGGGRVASSVAIMLHSNGYKVLITEREHPLTLYRGNSFSQAVTEMYKKINGVDAYLVAPGKQQISKAWEASVIPVIIDPDIDCLALFDKSAKVSSIYDDRLNSNTSEMSDPLSYFRNLEKSAWQNNSEQSSSQDDDATDDSGLGSLGFSIDMKESGEDKLDENDDLSDDTNFGNEEFQNAVNDDIVDSNDGSVEFYGEEADREEIEGDNIDGAVIEGDNNTSAEVISTFSENTSNSDKVASALKINSTNSITTGGSVIYSDGIESDFHSNYELFAVCDFTSPNLNKPTLKETAPVTVGINEYHYFYNGPDNLVSIKYGFGYGKMIKNPLNSYFSANSSQSQSNVINNKAETEGACTNYIKDEKKDEKVLYNDQDFICETLSKHIYVSDDGIYREIRKIGDRIEAGDVIGEITNTYNEKTSITSDAGGTLIASQMQGSLCKKGMYVAVVDSSIMSKDECYSVFPLDNAIATGVISILNDSLKDI